MPKSWTSESVSALLRDHLARNQFRPNREIAGNAQTAAEAAAVSLVPYAKNESTISDVDMAWLLVDAADACLEGHERTLIFVELGCGENNLAIERIVNAVASGRTTLPLAVIDRLRHWLDGYVGGPEEPQLRATLAEIQAEHAARWWLTTTRSEREG